MSLNHTAPTNHVNMTPLDHIAQSYWQDFIGGRAIDGGVNYEAELKASRLDLTLDSLKRVDALLTAIRRDLLKRNVKELVFLGEEKNRNLLLFVAFYVGEVFKSHGAQITWLGRFELQQNFYKLTLSDEFFHFMALQFVDKIVEKSQTEMQSKVQQVKVQKAQQDASLFFVLEVIGARLFAHIDRPFQPVLGEVMEDSVYAAVKRRLETMSLAGVKANSVSVHNGNGHNVDDKNDSEKTDNVIEQSETVDGLGIESATLQETIPSSMPNTMVTDEDVSRSNTDMGLQQAALLPTKQEVQTQIAAETANAKLADVHKADKHEDSFGEVNTSSQVVATGAAPSAITDETKEEHEQPVSQETAIQETVIQKAVDEEAKIEVSNIEKTSAEKTGIEEAVTKNAVVQTPAKKKVQDPYADVRRELREIEVPQLQGVKSYQNSAYVLDQFDGHILKQEKPRNEVVFSAKHEQSRKKALKVLAESAQQGNTTAMLRLALHLLTGEAIAQNQEKAAELVKKTADAGDMRAQKLLSKLYYQGIGVQQDVVSGKHWLDKSAESGHPEAKKLQAQWQHMQWMQDEREQDVKSSKRYLIWAVVVLVFALLVMVFF